MYRTLMTLLFFAMTTTGCDFVGGLMRHAELEGQLTPECVRRGLEQTEGVSGIRYRAPGNCGGYHRFDYRVADLDNHLLFESRYGAARYWNEYSRLNSYPPQSEVDRIRPHLKRIDASIGHACGIEDLPSHVSEDCRYVECR